MTKSEVSDLTRWVERNMSASPEHYALIQRIEAMQENSKKSFIPVFLILIVGSFIPIIISFIYNWHTSDWTKEMHENSFLGLAYFFSGLALMITGVFIAIEKYEDIKNYNKGINRY